MKLQPDGCQYKRGLRGLSLGRQGSWGSGLGCPDLHICLAAKGSLESEGLESNRVSQVLPTGPSIRTYMTEPIQTTIIL